MRSRGSDHTYRKPVAHLPLRPRLGWRDLEERDVHHEQSDDHRDVRGRIHEEAGCDADDADQQAGDGRTDDPRHVDVDGVQRHSVVQVLAADHLHDERLAGRVVERSDAPERKGAQVHHPELDGVGRGEDAERERDEAEGDLGNQKHPPLREAIGHQPAERGEQEHGKELQRDDETERRAAARQLEDQPSLGDGLHPGARQRDRLADHVEPVVPTAVKGAEGLARLVAEPGSHIC